MENDLSTTSSMTHSAEAIVKKEEFQHTSFIHKEQIMATPVIANTVKKEEQEQDSKILLQQSAKFQADSCNVDQDMTFVKGTSKNYDICNVSFISNSSKKNHLASNRHERMIATASQASEVLPAKYDPNNYCKVCNKYYKRNGNLRSHLKNFHKMTRTPRRRDLNVLPDTDDPNSYCRSCKYTYASRKSYGSHLIRVHDMSITPLPPKFNRNVIPNPFDPNFLL